VGPEDLEGWTCDNCNEYYHIIVLPPVKPREQQVIKDLDAGIVEGDPEMSDYNARQTIQQYLVSLGHHEIVTAWEKVPRL